MSRPTVRRALTAGAIAIGAVVGAGCSSHVPHMSNGSVSACYRAIPAASGVLHEPKAHLIGVHRIPADRVAAHLPPRDRATIDNDTQVCAVAWRGAFNPGQVDGARATDHGRYAIVLVTSRHLKVLSTFVMDQLPHRFQGRFV